MPEGDHSTPEERLGFSISQLQIQLGVQRETLDRYDTKAAIVIAASGLLLGRLLDSTPNWSSAPLLRVLIWVAALVASITAVTYAIVVVWPRGTRIDPNPTRLKEYLDEKNVPQARRDLVKSMEEGYQENKRRIGDSVRWLRASFIAFLIGVVFASISVIQAKGAMPHSTPGNPGEDNQGVQAR